MDERKRSLRKEIVRLALPIALQQFMTALVGACDAIMLGKLSQDAMSAVSLATQVTFVFNLFMFAFMAGENMFVAQYYGKGDYTGISQVFSLVTKICGCIAVIFLAGTLFFPEQLMRILTNEETLIVLGSEYLRVIGISYVFSGIAQTFLAIMKNCGAVNMSTLINGVMATRCRAAAPALPLRTSCPRGWHTRAQRAWPCTSGWARTAWAQVTAARTRTA